MVFNTLFFSLFLVSEFFTCGLSSFVGNSFLLPAFLFSSPSFSSFSLPFTKEEGRKRKDVAVYHPVFVFLPVLLSPSLTKEEGLFSLARHFFPRFFLWFSCLRADLSSFVGLLLPWKPYISAFRQVFGFYIRLSFPSP